MKNRNFRVVVVLFLGLFVGVFSCKKDKNKNPNDSTSSFDKTAMLSYYADQIIMPGYDALYAKLADLESKTNVYLLTPNEANKLAALSAHVAAHKQYAQVAAFQFGPAESQLLDLFFNFSGGLDYNFNTAGTLTGFSVDTAAIERNISTGSYDLTQMTRSSFYSQGFSALAYVLFAPDALTIFNSSEGGKRALYAKALVNRMLSLCTKVSNDWAVYRGTFVSNTKTNVGSPIGNMVNQLAFQMDVLKGPRLGWPLGKQSNGVVFATKVEGYYAQQSVSVAVSALEGLKAVYTGNGSGKGLSDYLVALNQSSLNTDVLAQFDVAITAVKTIPDPLSTTLSTNTAVVDNAYKEVQKLLTLLKTDVASATAVQITFMDNDGD